MKLSTTVFAASIAALLLAAPVFAKGPAEATVSGPGLKHGSIHFRGGGGDPQSGTPLGKLTEFGGYFPATFGQSPDPMSSKRPESKLGPRYTVEYKVPGPHGGTAIVRQDLYPYATPDPVTFTPRGQAFFDGQKTHGGWFLAPRALKSTLVSAGLPVRPRAGASGNASSFGWGTTTAIAAALLLLAVSYMTLRRRPGAPRR
jgi:hypothetical protein